MQIFIINLESSKQRLEFQKDQFETLNLNFERIAAVSTNDISDQDYERLGFGWQRPLRKVEVACFLSHKKAWEKVILSQQPALILEDDAVVAQTMAAVLGKIDAANFLDIDLINFEVRSRKKIISKQPMQVLKDCQIKLFDLYQDRTGAAGYLLYPSGAEKLLKRLEKTAPAIADGFIFSTYELSALQAEPALIIQEDQLQAYGLIAENQFDSTIGRSEHHNPIYRSVAEKKAFKQRRILGQWHMACRYLQVMFKAQKRFIFLDRDQFK
ncbi:hypothetical protein GFH30_02430 [Acinetobacter wanghuae]|uniref:Glycosyl transferase family 25 domain-containing protein n=1 Tax=Acinetobacter wanghuae TaxID=2662362 RepID=A0A5Q0P0N8_9GAMM|nr:glycosyltransferase family 25 protein [Acinetobacter wanghuae]MQW90843.1 hypothetical protein [Acinetobacter wanghuae]QGA10324.1 hypothetical protein GFH30_02430 [Acinetobacter wanghuae]